MARRRIGQETLAFVSSDAGRRCSLDDLHDLIDWAPIDRRLASISCSAKGEPAWPPLALFKAMLLAVWYDLSDVKLAEALDDRASFRRYCGFSGDEATPERTTFVRFRKALIAHLDKALFDEIATQLKAKAIRVKTGTLVDATIIASASEGDGEARWVKHKGRAAVYGFKAHVGADADTALVEEIAITPANVNDGKSRTSGPAGRARRGIRRQRVSGKDFSRGRPGQGRLSARRCDRHVGSRRGGNVGASLRLGTGRSTAFVA